MFAHRGFSGEHDRVAAVENGVGDVGGLRARGTGIVDHAFQHLGGGDDRFADEIAGPDDAFLDQRHLLRIHLHAQVAARHHDRVHLAQNGLKIVQSLRFLDFRHDGHPPAAHQRAQFAHIGGLPDKGLADIVHAVFEAEGEILAILFRNRRRGNHGARQVDPLVVAQRSAHHYPAADFVARNVKDGQLHVSIIQQDPLAGAHILGQTGIGGGKEAVLSQHIAGGDGHLRAGLQVHRAVFHQAGADLGALQIAQDGNSEGPVRRLFPDNGDEFRLFLLSAVRKIQPEHIHAAVHQGADHVAVFRSRPQGSDNLGTTFHVFSPS